MLVVGFFENSLTPSLECGTLVRHLREEGLDPAVEQAATYRLTVYLEQVADPPAAPDRERIVRAFRRFTAGGGACAYLEQCLARWPTGAEGIS